MNPAAHRLAFRTAVADSKAYSSGDDLYGYSPHRSHGKGRRAGRSVKTMGAHTIGSSLFQTSPNPNAGYLIETDPRFAGYRNWLSSDYMLNALSIDPAATQKRLGDGYYEQKLVREQVAQLTGRRFLDGYANDEAQYRALIDNAVSYAQAWDLRPGIALTAEQMAALTSDIVWLVEKTVTLPNGQTARALVPQVYVRVKEGDINGAGALLSGSQVNLDLKGDLTNSGTLAGREVLTLNAENIRNLGGRISGNDVGVQARTDLNNIGGKIEAMHTLTASAGRDLNVATTTTRTQTGSQGSRTNIDRVAGLYVTGSGGTLTAAAGRDLNLDAAAILNAASSLAGEGAGSTLLAAGNNLNLGTVAEAQRHDLTWDSRNYRKESSRSDIGTTIQTQGDLRLSAGTLRQAQGDRGDINAKAASITSEQGALLATAGGNINLTAGEANVQRDEASHSQSRGSWGSKKTVATRDTLNETTALGTTFSGNTAAVQAGQDINLKGSNIVSTQGTTLAAGNNINLEAATNSLSETHFRDEKKTGIFSSGGVGFTIGTRQQSTGQQGAATTAAASTVGSIQGDVDIRAGKAYRQTGSDVLAPQGDIGIEAQKIDITEAQNASRSSTETRFKQSGLTIALTSPAISAVQTAKQMKDAAGQTRDTRMQALAAGNAALSAKSGYDAVQANPGQAGGINLSLSIGNSQSQSNSVQTSSTAQGSTVAAGGNVNLSATSHPSPAGGRGAGGEGDITIQGSTVQAGNDITLKADGDINLLAAKNTFEQHSTNKSSSASIGASIGTSGFGVTVAASQGRGNADGSDVTWSNTRVEAGNKLTLASGALRQAQDGSGDLNIKGAVASGQQVVADVGGNLNIESLQDTSQYDSKQQSLGGSLTIGAGVSGSISAGKSKVNSSFASVTEQSGIQAGDGGFQVEVKGNADLKGAVIASTDKAVQDGKNSLSTGTLTTSDIQNKAEANAKSSGINLSSDMLTQGKYGVAKGVIGNVLNNASESSNSSGQTRSAVSAGTVTITDDGKQQQLTGKTAEATVANLNRDTANAHTAAQKLDIEQMKQTVEAERAIKEQTIKMVTAFTDETYRSRFQQQPKAIKVECPVGANCDADPSKLTRSLATADDIKNADPGSILAVNGILNDEKRAAELGYQNIEPSTNTQTGQREKPTTIYVMHIAPANNTISELLGVAYEKIVTSADYGLANFLGYTNAMETYAALLASRGQQETTSLGHSRGTLIQESSFTILANRPDANGNTYTNPNLTVRGVGGAADAQSYTDKAAKIINDPEQNKNITYNYFSNDPVSTSTLSGGNPGVWTLKDLWQVFDTNNSLHSCYGTGAKGCTQVEIPLPGSPNQGTPEGNAKLIRFKGGQQVDRSNRGHSNRGQTTVLC